MTAKEMFESAGYTKVSMTYIEGELRTIKYTKYIDTSNEKSINFNLNANNLISLNNINTLFPYEIEAIYQQCKELGACNE